LTNSPTSLVATRRAIFILPDVKVSGKHAKITVSGDQFFIEDLNSTNHTFVMGQQLDPLQPARLSNPARVRFGPDTEVEFQAL
jgi:pSer/pThr/pTyr-binding forkhead associated (FHA) protein